MATIFDVTLSGDQEVPPTGSAASGTGTVTWDEATESAAYEITVQGLDFGPVLGLEAQTETTDDDVMNMHVHNAERGVNGPVVFGQISPAHDDDDLDIVQNEDGSWTVTGTWEPADPANTSITSFADALSVATSGSDVPLYFNVHTPPFPAGEIRGQWVASDAEEPPGGERPDIGAVDWEALAARILAFLEATGRWGLLSEWLGDTPPDGGGSSTMMQSEVDLSAAGHWHL